jgi:sulfate adenylyltransferase subunit 1 (EFTu-like GTPase family)
VSASACRPERALSATADGVGQLALALVRGLEVEVAVAVARQPQRHSFVLAAAQLEVLSVKYVLNAFTFLNLSSQTYAEIIQYFNSFFQID